MIIIYSKYDYKQTIGKNLVAIIPTSCTALRSHTRHRGYAPITPVLRLNQEDRVQGQPQHIVRLTTKKQNKKNLGSPSLYMGLKSLGELRIPDVCVCCIYGLYFQMKKLELKETELLPKVQKLEESRIRIRTLNLNFYHHGKGRVKHLFGCLLSIGRIYSHMIFWAVILKDSFLPGATLGLGHHLPHQSSYKAHLQGSGGMPSGF